MSAHRDPSPFHHVDSPRLVKLKVPLDADDHCAEHVWAEPAGGDCYRIASIPWYARHLGLLDLVIALPHQGDLEFVEVVERRCLATVDFELRPGADAAALVDSAEPPAVAIEMSDHRWGSACISELDEVVPFLERLEPDAAAFDLFCSCGKRLYAYKRGSDL